jgi:hypothetical protein
MSLTSCLAQCKWVLEQTVTSRRVLHIYKVLAQLHGWRRLKSRALSSVLCTQQGVCSLTNADVRFLFHLMLYNCRAGGDQDDEPHLEFIAPGKVYVSWGVSPQR